MGMTETLRLKDQPEWVYLMRDLYEFYRRQPAGGSSVIRSHQRKVREAISGVIKVNAELRP